ncbi:helix-turn-helix domain-containing protein [Leptospira sp. 2 VSF19]|uniref:Helix-turn-helix domain-containing protein n=1 Tax=Leptospira soteropolitanensis TaxID=2950025 RepID=A0AAW5VJC3_9LEPT|nr:helix-turn-helix domain-containing protein [Leptospira soteropolitanensis]MCW7491139.1 helix-turn-helix domain-containing protein [Leptospira soteropolitanensis]MCW7498723.1 helix-turn-helix domain-containing protein [Leptospira soteropolitanensis]MCW7521684.1 helix-turn-helix domain-containing protein [Leptospira soteropolitanensis]MCW7524827.1 helix-turn-helix domain-containing protein [Leptospira soteropolitanensis]MCW7528694.1 helix-turn-helix domain-containing protein [Leptospira soter
MKQMVRITLLLAIFAGLDGCLWKPESFYGRNISRDVQFLVPQKTEIPKNCSHESIQSLRNRVWIDNRSADAMRGKREEGGQWVRFQLTNDLEMDSQFSVLIQWINIPFVELCSEGPEGNVIDSYSGYVWEDWLGILSPFPHFNVTLLPKESRYFFVYLISNEDLNFPIRTVSQSGYRSIVLFRFLTFLFFSMVGIVSFGWAFSEYFKSKERVYLSILIHFLMFFLLVYSVHGKEFASVFGNTNNLVRHSYYLFLSINHFVFFVYLATFDQFIGNRLSKNFRFWISGVAGFLYLLVPLFPRVYEFRIFLVLSIFGTAAYHLYKTHETLLSKQESEDRAYVFGWFFFLFSVFLKTLFHFDFYPYQPFFIYASVFYLPFLTAGSFLFLRNYEKKDKSKTRYRSLTTKLDKTEFRNKLELLLGDEKVYLDPNCNEELIASKMGLSYHQLSELINSEYNFNFPSLLNQYRIKEAMVLLNEKPELNIAEVGRLSGFGSRSAFYLEFKKQSGVNPNQFRKTKGHLNKDS